MSFLNRLKNKILASENNFAIAKSKAKILIKIIKGGGDVDGATEKMKRQIKDKNILGMVKSLVYNETRITLDL